MDAPFTPLKQSTQNWQNKGFTLIELVIASAVSLVVLSVTLGLVVEQRRQFLGNQSKIDFNQNLRAASEFIGTDIKQVGERIDSSSNIPVVRLISGSGSAPDTLILQRKLLQDYLSLCSPASNNSELTIATKTGSNNCNFSDGNTPSNNLTDSLDKFKEYRCDLESGKTNCLRGNDDLTSAAITTASLCDSECVYAYIYDPSDNVGEFFLYTDEIYEDSSGNITNKLKTIPLSNGSNWVKAYPTGSQIYILEEKKYALCEGIFQMTLNRRPDYGNDCPYPDTGLQPIRLVEGINNMQIRILTKAGWVDNYNNNLSSISKWKGSEAEDNGTALRKIEVNLETTTGSQINTTSKTLTLKSEFYPRNAIN